MWVSAVGSAECPGVWGQGRAQRDTGFPAAPTQLDQLRANFQGPAEDSVSLKCAPLSASGARGSPAFSHLSHEKLLVPGPFLRKYLEAFHSLQEIRSNQEISEAPLGLQEDEAKAWNGRRSCTGCPVVTLWSGKERDSGADLGATWDEWPHGGEGAPGEGGSVGPRLALRGRGMDTEQPDGRQLQAQEGRFP